MRKGLKVGIGGFFLVSLLVGLIFGGIAGGILASVLAIGVLLPFIMLLFMLEVRREVQFDREELVRLKEIVAREEAEEEAELRKMKAARVKSFREQLERGETILGISSLESVDVLERMSTEDGIKALESLDSLESEIGTWKQVGTVSYYSSGEAESLSRVSDSVSVESGFSGGSDFESVPRLEDERDQVLSDEEFMKLKSTLLAQVDQVHLNQEERVSLLEVDEMAQSLDLNSGIKPVIDSTEDLEE